MQCDNSVRFRAVVEMTCMLMLERIMSWRLLPVRESKGECIKEKQIVR